MRKLAICSALILTACLLLHCGKKEKKSVAQTQQGGSKPPPMRVDVYVIRPRPLTENLELPGSLIANEATEIHPEISGRVVMLNVREGSVVARGTVLAKLYDGDLQAQLRKLQTQLAIAQQNEHRSAELLKIQGISRQDYDMSLLNVNNIKADMDLVRANISKTVIRAPFTGRLGLKNISPGAFVTPQTVIATIRQTNQLKLDFTLPEKYTGRIRPGHTVSFRVEGNQKTYGAKVMALESGITENTRTLNVRALVMNPGDELVPGTFARVITHFPADSGAIMVPTQAILPQARGKKLVLYKSGTAIFADVVTGIRDTSHVQIVDGRVKAGDTVVTTGLLSVRPESKIQVNRVIN
ncbi:MAG TPA: efflux RND transporter periplasmic adaptor subunit [Chitinophagaceae bacterium]|nr:efflux RND transporter periplasmic adaptor subunit [Chitinophagaceae bacterium]